MTIPVFRNRPDSFIFAADKRLFHHLRQRDVRQYLARFKLRFYFGCYGTIQFVPAMLPTKMNPNSRSRKWLTVTTMAFDTGRVYLNFGGQREGIAANFHEVTRLVVENYAQLEHLGESPTMPDLLRSMPEAMERPDPETLIYPSRAYTPFHLEVTQYRHARGLIRRAAFERWKAAQPGTS